MERHLGVVDASEDDWLITESDLVDSQFAVTVPLDLTELVERENVVVTLEVLNEDQVVLDELLLTFEGEEVLPAQGPWMGGIYNGSGHWLPPITGDFMLERKAMQVKFWVDDTTREKVSIGIFEVETNELGERAFGDLEMKISSNEIVSKNCGKFSQISEGTISGSYYKVKLKAKVLSSDLREGRTYIMALMVGDDLLMFSEDQPATVEFIIADGAMTKGGMNDTLGSTPKRLSSNRTLAEE
jgi:hypothetical protein